MSNNLNFVKWARDAQLSKSCFQMHRIYNYEPGHVKYEFGHYPASEPYYPTGDDWGLLDYYSENGVGLINLWWWSDWCGYFGKGVLEPINEKGLRRFIYECHCRGLEVIPYVSPGYMDIRNPIYRPEWSRGAGHLVEIFFDCDKLCPGSPGYRTHFFSTIERLMDSYGFDGFYLDGGLGLSQPGCSNQNHDNHIHFAEIATEGQANTDHIKDDVVKKEINDAFCALWNEFLCEIYSRIKNKGGIIVAHIGSDTPSPFQDKCWDYQLVGEGIGNIIKSVDKTKYYDPYVIRIQDWSRLITDWKKKDLSPHLELVPGIVNLSMASSIPYLQFPWLEGGCYGEKEDLVGIPGVKLKEGWDHWTEWHKALQKAGNPFRTTALVRDTYFKYLRLYKKMTKPNTIVYIEVVRINGNSFPATEGSRRVSVFVNDSLWVAISNLGTEIEKVLVRSLKGDDKGETVVLNSGTITILRYYDMILPPQVFKLY